MCGVTTHNGSVEIVPVQRISEMIESYTREIRVHSLRRIRGWAQLGLFVTHCAFVRLQSETAHDESADYHYLYI